MDSFTETTHTSFFQRIKNALFGIIFGLILFIGSFFLLAWNEGRSAHMIEDLNDIKNAVISIPSTQLNPNLENRLIHTSGKIQSSAPLTHPQYNITIENGLRIKAIVEMYQWEETTSSKTTKNLGGSETTETTYNYHKEWSSEEINSQLFRKKNYNNPKMPFQSSSVETTHAKMGSFRITPHILKKLENLSMIPAHIALKHVQGTYLEDGQWLYQGKDPKSPEVGDIRIRFESLQETDASIIGMQYKNNIISFMSDNQTKHLFVEQSITSANNMIQQEMNDNAFLTWILRLVGFIAMTFGIGLILRPLSVLGDIIPFVGYILETGIGFVSIVIALPLTFLTIAISWFAYRPLLSISLITIIAVFIYFLPQIKQRVFAFIKRYQLRKGA